jgi:hypothetical protein
MRNSICTFLFCLAFLALSSFRSAINFQDTVKLVFSRKGNHPKEIGLGSYIIIDSAATRSTVRQKEKFFKKTGFKLAGCGYVTGLKFWYVYLGPFEGGLDEAFIYLRDNKIEEKFGNPYILKVK